MKFAGFCESPGAIGLGLTCRLCLETAEMDKNLETDVWFGGLSKTFSMRMLGGKGLPVLATYCIGA